VSDFNIFGEGAVSFVAIFSLTVKRALVYVADSNVTVQ